MAKKVKKRLATTTDTKKVVTKPLGTKTSAEPAKKKKAIALHADPVSVILYGPPNVGKTSLLLEFPDVGFIIDPKERGAKRLVQRGQAKKPLFIWPDEDNPLGEDDWLGFLDLIEQVDRDKCAVLVIEAVTGIENICFRYHCKETYNNDWSDKGFFSYSKGPKSAAKSLWHDFLTAVDDLQERGVSIFLTGHTSTKPELNPEGEDYNRFILACDKEIWLQTKKWSEAILFFNFSVTMSDTKKADVDYSRLIGTEWAPSYDAKNWLGLPDIIDAGTSPKEGAEELMKALKIPS